MTDSAAQRPVRVTFLTPGTGSYYCGACMRDNALAKALRSAGHEVSLLPMYLPLRLDEEALDGGPGTPVFFGGINVFLEQKFALFRHTPRWFDRLLNGPRLLRMVARHSHMTSAREHGEMTLAMLRVEHSGFGKELDKLVEWLERENHEVLCLSTALQAGMIRELKRRLGVKVICCFQGEDAFLDGLPGGWRDDCWRELAERVREADVRVAPSRFYADLMERRLGGGLGIEVMPNGIDLAGYRSAAPGDGPPVIGYLARMIRDKGLEVMVDAFLHLRTTLGRSDARLRLAGTTTAGDEPLIAELKGRIERSGLADSVEWMTDISHDEKAAFLGSLSLFSVPATYPEAFGLYLVEALAAGVPVVQPDAASFPEIIGDSGAGVLVAPGDAAALARAWHDLLGQPERLRDMGERARRVALESYSVEAMRDRFLAVARRLG